MGVSGQIPKLPRCSVDNSEVYSVSQTAPSESKPLFLHIAADGGTFMSASSFPPSLSLLLYLCFLNTSEMNQLLSNPAPELLLRNPNLVAEFILLLGHNKSAFDSHYMGRMQRKKIFPQLCQTISKL